MPSPVQLLKRRSIIVSRNHAASRLKQASTQPNSHAEPHREFNNTSSLYSHLHPISPTIYAKYDPTDQGYCSDDPVTGTGFVDSILATDPYDLERRWSDIRAIVKEISSKNKKASDLPKDSAFSTPPSTAFDVASQADSNATSSRRQVIGQRSKNFRIHILREERQVDIEEGARLKRLDPCPHFGTDSISATETHSQFRRAARSPSVWLDDDAGFCEDVASEYTWMENRGHNEAEFVNFAIEQLLRRPLYSRRKSEMRQWLPLRRSNASWKPQPDQHWDEPPCTKIYAPSAFAFDIQPDCTYWLSVDGFNPRYREYVRDCTFVFQSDMIAPYLTIEFKRDQKSKTTAENQAAAAGSMALYNRWLLRKARQDALGPADPHSSLPDLRHYALTLEGAHFQFWVLTPRWVESDNYVWSGCLMNKLARGNLSSKDGVATFVRWINEIHRWAVTVHGPAVEGDVKACLDEADFDTSGVGQMLD